jgi:RHS repeat-associated protein
MFERIIRLSPSALRIFWVLIGVVGSFCTSPAEAQSSPAPAEIIELARALKNDPDLIYEYVYNNIETLPQYGSAKGPLGALLDGKGTSFDQAELMVALLQQAGFSASFQLGQIQLTVGQLTNWLGTDTTLGSVDITIGSGGFPGTIVGNPVVTSAQIGWAWVSVNIGGTTYVFDPSTKVYNRSAGLGPMVLASTLGYSQSTFINDAENGATITPSSIVGLNRANIRNDLTSYANNLVQFIRTNNPAAATSDIIGGKTITPLAIGTQLRQTSLSYAVGTIQTQPMIPSAYRTTLTLTLGSNDSSNNFTALASAITFNSSDIYNHRLIVSFNASSIPSLLLDGATQVTATAAVPAGRQLTVRSTISHPYPNGFVNVTNNDQVRMTPFANFIYLVGTGWGQVGRGTIEKHRKLLQDNIAVNPGNPSAESVWGESLAMIGYTWLAEVAQQELVMDQLAGTNTIYHHAVGVVGTKAVGTSSGPYVDLPLNDLSIVQRVGRPDTTPTTPSESAAFFSDAFFSSIAESGTLEQTQPGATAASTVKLIDTTIQSGGKIFDINNSAVSGDNCAAYSSPGGIRSQLSAYQAPDLQRIDSLVGFVSGTGCKSTSDPTNANLRVIAPLNGAISIGLYTGVGYFQIAQDGSSIGSIISGGLSGGEPASPVTLPEIVDNTPQSFTPAPTQSTVITNPQGSQGNAGGNVGATQTSNEPINLVTGDYLNSATDLTVGSQAMPFGLAFQRYYDSGTRSRKGPMGLGWRHNFAITASTDSDAFAGMAANSPVSGAVAIAATFVTLDILNAGASNAKPLDRIVIASLIQRWLMDQLTTNIVAVAQPGYVEHFTKLADGSYNPPPGSATALTSIGGAFNYLAKNQQTLSFDTAGNLKTLTNPAGTTITLGYAGTPEVLSSVTNNLGWTLNFTYSSGLLTQVSDGNGRGVSYAYDAANNLTGCTDPLGQTTNYAYDIPGRLTQIFDPASAGRALVTNTYDSLGRVNTQASGANPPWQYFLAGARSEEVDPFRTRHVIYTTPRGKTRAEIQDLAGLNLVTVNAFDALDRLVSTTAPEGRAVGYTYDSRSNVLTVTSTPKPGSPLAPQVTTYRYDPIFNKPTSITDPLGLVTSISYDGATGNLVTSISDFGGSPHVNARRSFSYNNVGQVLTTSDPLGSVTQFAYDSFGNQTSIIHDAGAGRLNQLVTIGYSVIGDATSITDPRGNTATSAYDAARHLTATTAPSGLVTTYRYDPDGRIVQAQQSANGTVLRSTAATYTLTGKPATATDANSNTTNFSYDGLDRVSSVIDAMGRVTSYGYDPLSRQISVSNPAIQGVPMLQQAYTPDGLLASLTDANNHATGFVYDGFDRLATTTYPLGSTEALTYDADGNVLTRKTRAGDTIAFTYDTLNRLKTKRPPSPAPVFSYAYDLAGRLTAVSDTSAAIAAAVPPSGTSVQYATSTAYDALNRPTAVAWTPAPTAAAPTAGSVTFGHAYNKANQRIGQTVTDNNWFNYPAATPSTVSYTADALNRYIAVGAVTPTYDGNGNLTADGTFTFGYDSENRLTSAVGAGNTAAYTYDAKGQRRTKTVNGTTTVFVNDAYNREVLEYDGANGAIQRWYAYGLGSNDVLSQMNVVAGTRTTLVPDIQGSVVASLDSSAGALSRSGYLPYGKSASAPGSFGYTAQRIDPETNGLYYYRARHYNPAWGRFLQADPIGYGGGINLYAYVRNDPLNLIDPFGRAALASLGELSPTFYQGISRNTQTALATALDYCAALCDPGVQASIGDPLGAGIFRALGAFARLVTAADEVATAVTASGGRLGSAATRAQNAGIAADLQSQGYTITRGGGLFPEEYIPGIGPGTRGSTYVDITAQHGVTGETLRVQTIDALANGSPTAREAAAAARIKSAFPNDTLQLIPKP